MSKLMDRLPEFCFTALPTSGEVVLVKRFESGYFPYYEGTYKGEDRANELNERLGVTKAQAEAMQTGSILGWDSRLADPDSYNEDGSPKKVNGDR